MFRNMQRRQKLSQHDQMRDAIEEIGGEPLEGSGFEKETPEECFSGASVLPSTFIELTKD